MSNHEINTALKESERLASEEVYFSNKPELACTEAARVAFRNGFNMAWEILHTGRKTNGKLIPPAPFVQMD